MYQEVWQPENNFCPYFHSISKTGIFMVIVTQQCCKKPENFTKYSITRKRHSDVLLQQLQNSNRTIFIKPVGAKLI